MVAVARLVLIGVLAIGVLATVIVGPPSLVSVEGPLCIHSAGKAGR